MAPGDYARVANEQTLVAIMLEEVEALDNLDDILKVDHIDVFFVAPGDLAQSMGVPGQMTHPRVTSAIEDALKEFRSQPLDNAALKLFGILGYQSEKRFTLKPNSAATFLSQFGQHRQEVLGFCGASGKRGFHLPVIFVSSFRPFLGLCFPIRL